MNEPALQDSTLTTWREIVDWMDDLARGHDRVFIAPPSPPHRLYSAAARFCAATTARADSRVER
jgi:hypothetical protein